MSYFSFPGMGYTFSWSMQGIYTIEKASKEAKIDKDIVRDCYKCVYQVGCHGNPVGCKRYKRDAPDGGYYG